MKISFVLDQTHLKSCTPFLQLSHPQHVPNILTRYLSRYETPITHSFWMQNYFFGGGVCFERDSAEWGFKQMEKVLIQQFSNPKYSLHSPNKSPLTFLSFGGQGVLTVF